MRKLVVIAAIVVAALIATVFPNMAQAATPCDEWANFTKIITYRFRDAGLPRELVKEELARSMGKNPEIDVANGWIDYTYDHEDKDPVQIWKDVYRLCGGSI